MSDSPQHLDPLGGSNVEQRIAMAQMGVQLQNIVEQMREFRNDIRADVKGMSEKMVTKDEMKSALAEVNAKISPLRLGVFGAVSMLGTTFFAILAYVITHHT